MEGFKTKFKIEDIDSIEFLENEIGEVIVTFKKEGKYGTTMLQNGCHYPFTMILEKLQYSIENK